MHIENWTVWMISATWDVTWMETNNAVHWRAMEVFCNPCMSIICRIV